MMMMRKTMRSEAGFTLVEISIVLIIIGLILGAAVKGKDLIQSAKQKKFYNNFIKQWEVTILNAYDRTGGVIGDGTVNGGTNAATDGRFDNINTASEWTTVLNRLKAIGIDVPTTNTGTSYTYSFKGKTSGTRTVTANLYNLWVHTNGGGAGPRVATNCIYFTQMPTDLAIAMDRIIDDTADGMNGKFRRWDDTSDWPDVTTTSTVNAVYILDVP